MEAIHCQGDLSPYEIHLLEEESILRLYTCGNCGRRNLYAIKDSAGHWGLEAHSKPQSHLPQELTHQTRS
jgi:hypothetical protein